MQKVGWVAFHTFVVSFIEKILKMERKIPFAGVCMAQMWLRVVNQGDIF